MDYRASTRQIFWCYQLCGALCAATPLLADSLAVLMWIKLLATATCASSMKSGRITYRSSVALATFVNWSQSCKICRSFPGKRLSNSCFWTLVRHSYYNFCIAFFFLFNRRLESFSLNRNPFDPCSFLEKWLCILGSLFEDAFRYNFFETITTFADKALVAEYDPSLVWVGSVFPGNNEVSEIFRDFNFP